MRKKSTAFSSLAKDENTTSADQQQTSRQSTTNAKTFVLGILQLINDSEAAAMAVSIHCSSNDMDLIRNVTAAVRLIIQKTGPTNGLQTINKIREVLPDVYMAPFRELALEIESGLYEL